MRPRLLIVLTMSAGGLLAGLAGAIEILGVGLPARPPTRRTSASTPSRWRCWAAPTRGGILFGGLLFGAMRAGCPADADPGRHPVQMIDVLQGVILFFLAADLIVRWVFRLKEAPRRRGRAADRDEQLRRLAGGQTRA